MNIPIDIFITAYLRPEYTKKTLEYLYERTNYPFNVYLLDNGGNGAVAMLFEEKKNFHHIEFHENLGIHCAWNIALQLAQSEYFITSDNDIYVPDLRDKLIVENKFIMDGTKGQYPDWLERLVTFMDERPDYGAISLHPHVFIGIAGEDPNDPEDVKEASMAGAVMRIMRTDAVLKVGGWEHKIDRSRNHEERTISSRLKDTGWKVGRTTRLRAYHPFGKDLQGNWGYDPKITPEMQGHNPGLKDYVLQFDNPDGYDNKTWLPK